MNTRVHLHLLTALFCAGLTTDLHAQGTAFTYQGRLTENGVPFTGNAEFRPTLWDALSGGAQVAANNPAEVVVGVTNGLFVLPLDFGENFPGAGRWLQLEVRTALDPFVVLSPRQHITPTPYAFRAREAAAVPTGTITSAMLADGAVTGAKLAAGAVSGLDTPDGNNADVLSVSNDGNLGAGTASPEARLHVTGGPAAARLELLLQLKDDHSGFNDLNGAWEFAANGDSVAITATIDDAVSLVDLSDPTAPVLIQTLRHGEGAFTSLNGPQGVAWSGNLLALGAYNSDAVTLVDVSNVAAPTVPAVLQDGVGGFDDLDGTDGIAINGNLLAIAARFDRAVTLVDVSNPAAPVERSVLKDGQFGFNELDGAAIVAFSGNLLAIAADLDSAVTLVDVSNPATPVLRATLKDGQGGFNELGGAYGLSISGSLMAIAGYADGAVTLVDIANPANPQLVSVIQQGVGGFEDLTGPLKVRMQGSMLAAAAYDGNAVSLVDIADPANPRLRFVARHGGQEFRELLQPGGLLFHNGNLLVSGWTSDAVAVMRPVTAGVSLATDGWVGVGTATPAAPLHVKGSVLMEDANEVRIEARHFTVGDDSSAVGLNSIALGSTNRTEGAFSGILGGRNNLIELDADESVIAGGRDNAIRAAQRSAFLGGGLHNEILQDNEHAVIVGGRDNGIGTNSVISLVGGGAENRIGDNVDGGLMVGGFRNDILGSLNPNRRQIAPVLLGGSDNEVGRSSSWAAILGGDNNRIGTNCPSVVIAGGTNNVVADNAGFSFAAGRRNRVNHRGSFMWADSQDANFSSAGINTFNVRAEGGVYLSGDTSQFFGSTVRQMLNLWGTLYGIGVQNGTLYFRTETGGSYSWHEGGTHSNNANSPGSGGLEIMRLNSGGLRVNGTFVSANDRNLKDNVQPVTPLDVLAKVAALPINEWNYRADPGARHVGPMAQDFHAAFGLGADDKHIATVDADGVALAAIQGLNQKLEAKLKQNETELAGLRRELAELRTLVTQLAQP